MAARSPTGDPKSKLLRELNAVPIRVVHVEQAHDALRDLDDDADVHALAPQALGLRLHVVDVDVRDDAVVARLALDEPDFHLPVLQMRPTLGEVDRVLLEAERLAVETPRRIELLDVVPDARRH